MSQRGSARWLLWLLGAGLAVWGLGQVTRRWRPSAREGYFRGKVVVITGASRGIGRALARVFARQGAYPVLAARSVEQLEAVSNECRVINPDIETLVIQTDVEVEAQLQNLVSRTLERFGRIDVLVNNAGVVFGGEFVGADPAMVRHLLEVNLLAVMRLTQLVLPVMLGQRKGHIVNISSVMGRHAIPYFSVYSVSKHGLTGFGEGLRRELAGTGVHVLTVNLGFVSTDMVSEEVSAMLRAFGVRTMTPENIAPRILEAIARGQVEINIGGIEFLAEWISHVAPNLADFMWQKLAPSELPEAAARLHTS